MASSAAAASPPVLSRLDRLDTMVGRLEELKGHRTAVRRSSATSSGTLTTDTGSVTSSPKSFVERDRWCRSIDDAVVEVKLKGTIIDRIYYLETRILKLEEEMEGVKRREEEDDRSPKRHSPGKGLKRLVKSCVKGHLNTKQ